MTGSIKLWVEKLATGLGKASAIVFVAFATLCMTPSGPRTADASGAKGLAQFGDAPYVVEFEKGEGRLIVVPPSANQNIVQFIIEARNLDRKPEVREYELFLHLEDGGGGVTFGQGALQVMYGGKKTDTIVVTSAGGILAWTIAPMRMVAGKYARVVLRRRDNWEEIAAQSAIFRGPDPRGGDIDR